MKYATFRYDTVEVENDEISKSALVRCLKLPIATYCETKIIFKSTDCLVKSLIIEMTTSNRNDNN